MRKKITGGAAACSLALILSGCAPNTGRDSATAPEAAPAITAIALAPEDTIQTDEAARLAKQASFGPTPQLINDIVAHGDTRRWLDAQMSLRESSYADLAAVNVTRDYCTTKPASEIDACTRDHFSATPVAMRFYANAISGKDQLRQRVAFALSEILVASSDKVPRTAGVAAYNQIFLDNAFGNYRDILQAVTLSPFMGYYLDMADSSKAQPNENYSREFLQLFSIGVDLLNADGTKQTDITGATIAAYSTNDVKEIARALTGWSITGLPGYALGDVSHRDFSRSMSAYPARFDNGVKSFLGASVPAGSSQDANVKAVVDAAFYHPNTGPFVSKRLIRQLTLANPTPAYVGRVAAVFADNGDGVRGDMRAVIRAIYTDSEARVVSQTPGKVKSPVLLATSLARAIGFETDGYAFTTRDAGMGQQPFKAPSVFGFYPDSFPLPQGAGVISPTSKGITTSSVIARHNLIYDWTVGGDAARTEYKAQATMKSAMGSRPDWTSWEAMSSDAAIIDRINLVLLNGVMTKAQRLALETAMAQIKSTDSVQQTRKRAQTALYIAASSPLFQVDR